MLFRVNGLWLQMHLNAAGSGEQSRGVTTLKRRLPGQHYVPQTTLCVQSYLSTWTGYLLPVTCPILKRDAD